MRCGGAEPSGGRRVNHAESEAEYHRRAAGIYTHAACDVERTRRYEAGECVYCGKSPAVGGECGGCHDDPVYSGYRGES